MHVVSVKALREFWTKHADAEQPLKAWFREATAANWASFDEIKARYRTADVIPGNRVIFN